MKKIVLTGGGTAGHINPNIALMPLLEKNGYSISYIGSIGGIEKELITPLNIDYYEIHSGKLRRYFAIKNITDAFRVVIGITDALKILRKIRPNVIFSKGGFVAVPVVIAGYMLKIPVIVHESDMSVGLANKICIPFAKKVCTTFKEALSYIPKDKGILTGTPIRESLFLGSRDMGLKLCRFKLNKPTVLIMGGSLGSVKINTVVRNSLPNLLEKYNIIHLCGKNNLDNSIKKDGYFQLEYATDNLAHFLFMSDIVVSRAGANAIFELLALKKPSLLIPLSKNASRGDQILNAKSFEKQGFSLVLYEEDLNNDKFIKNIDILNKDKDIYKKNMDIPDIASPSKKILDEIEKLI